MRTDGGTLQRVCQGDGALSTQVNRLVGHWKCRALSEHAEYRRRGCFRSDPKTSVLNRYLQSWDVPNRVSDGSVRVPRSRNAVYNRPERRALTYWSLGCDQEILKSPGRWCDCDAACQRRYANGPERAPEAGVVVAGCVSLPITPGGWIITLKSRVSGACDRPGTASLATPPRADAVRRGLSLQDAVCVES